MLTIVRYSDMAKRRTECSSRLSTEHCIKYKNTLLYPSYCIVTTDSVVCIPTLDNTVNGNGVESMKDLRAARKTECQRSGSQLNEGDQCTGQNNFYRLRCDRPDFRLAASDPCLFISPNFGRAAKPFDVLHCSLRDSRGPLVDIRLVEVDDPEG